MTSRGKTTWSKRSIETVLTNEKYVGDVILYKTFSPNFPEKKRIPNNGEHQKYIQENHHPAIISRETFRAVQEMRESRSNIERHADGTVTRKAKRVHWEERVNIDLKSFITRYIRIKKQALSINSNIR